MDRVHQARTVLRSSQDTAWRVLRGDVSLDDAYPEAQRQHPTPPVNKRDPAVVAQHAAKMIYGAVNGIHSNYLEPAIVARGLKQRDVHGLRVNAAILRWWLGRLELALLREHANEEKAADAALKIPPSGEGMTTADYIDAFDYANSLKAAHYVVGEPAQ